jgi:hypothetical protein
MAGKPLLVARYAWLHRWQALPACAWDVRRLSCGVLRAHVRRMLW